MRKSLSFKKLRKLAELYRNHIVHTFNKAESKRRLEIILDYLRFSDEHKYDELEPDEEDEPENEPEIPHVDKKARKAAAVHVK